MLNSDSNSEIDEWFSTFPILTFWFGEDAEYKWFPQDYLYVEGENFCIAFDYLEGRIILGGVFMRHYDIFFNKHKETVSFARSKCNDHDHVSNFKHVQHKVKDKIKRKKDREFHAGSNFFCDLELSLVLAWFFSFWICVICCGYFLWYQRFVPRNYIGEMKIEENEDGIEIYGLGHRTDIVFEEN